MKRPLFRAGQIIKCRNIDTIKNKESVSCQIIKANDDSTYLVRIKDNDTYSVVEDKDIETPSEMPHIDVNNTKIIFFGNGYFALPTLKTIFDNGYEIKAVVTMPDFKDRRTGKLTSSPIKQFAEEYGITVLQPSNLKDPKFIKRLYKIPADIGVVVEYGLLPKAVYAYPKFGTINLHSSLLPAYRGASTIASAIRNNEPETGVTTFILNDGIDTGNIINNLCVPIFEEDNAFDVRDRLSEKGALMVDSAIRTVIGGFSTTPQSVFETPFSPASYAPKLTRNDCAINWRIDALDVHNHIRSISPKPTAWTQVILNDGKSFEPIRVNILQTAITEIKTSGKFGLFETDGKRLYVSCGDYKIEILTLQIEGKKKMTSTEFLNGWRGLDEKIVMYWADRLFDEMNKETA